MPPSIYWPLTSPGTPAQSTPAISFAHASYVRQLKALLPPGYAFNLEGDSEVTKTLEAIAEELVRVDGRGVDLINEADPRTADETLEDWERVLSLPDDRVLVIPATTAERQVAITQKYIARGGQNVDYFVRLADACGYQLVDKTLATPTISSVVWLDSAGGTLTPGTKYYRVSAVNSYGETIASIEASGIVGAGTNTNRVQVNWTGIDGATSYRVFGRTTGGELCLASVVSTGVGAHLYVDTGAATPAGALPVGPNPLAYKAIEIFAGNGFFRVNDRVGERCYGLAYAYAMRLNVQDAASPPALSHADFERVIRHYTHSHVVAIFVYH